MSFCFSYGRELEYARAVQGRFTFYGLAIEVTSASSDLLEEVRRDFAYFHERDTDTRDRFEVRVDFAPPPYATLPSLPASWFTPRNVCFRDGTLTYIDYFGRAVAIFDRPGRRCTIYGTEADLVHEIVYLLVLSLVGDYLDRRGIHRVHALGVSHRGRGVLLVLPSGGGKSTMCLDLLRRPGFLLLGEDTPLVDRCGRILPFPLRVGVRPEQQPDIPPRYLRTMSRMEFDPKTLIDIEYFGDRLSGPVDPGLVLIGERNLGEVSEIVPLSRRRALSALVKYMVVGLGIYQGMEFLLERGVSEVLGKGGVAASRLYNATRLLARTPAYRFVLGRDIARNCETLVTFLART